MNKRNKMNGKEASLRWTPTEAEKLIKAFEKHPNLWDPNHKDYLNKSKKLDSYMNMAKVFGTSHFEIERKIKNLRVQFQRERRVQLNMKKRGKVFIPKWFGFASMSFLLDTFDHPKIERDDVKPEEEELSVGAVNQNGAELPNIVLKNEILQEPSIWEPVIRPELEAEPELQTSFEFPSCSYANPFEPNRNYKIVEEAFHLMRQTYERRVEEDKARDESSVFGELVAHGIRKLKNETVKAEVMSRINNVLVEAHVGKRSSSKK